MPFKDPLKQSEYAKRHYQTHKEKYAEQHKIWRAANAEYVKMKKKEYARMNKDRIRENRKLYNSRPEVVAARKAKNAATAVARKVYVKEYYQKNKDVRNVARWINRTQKKHGDWWQHVRRRVLRGKSTTKLPEKIADMWWQILQERVLAKWAEQYGDTRDFFFDPKSKEKYVGIFG